MCYIPFPQARLGIEWAAAASLQGAAAQVGHECRRLATNAYWWRLLHSLRVRFEAKKFPSLAAAASKRSGSAHVGAAHGSSDNGANGGFECTGQAYLRSLVSSLLQRSGHNIALAQAFCEAYHLEVL